MPVLTSTPLTFLHHPLHANTLCSQLPGLLHWLLPVFNTSLILPPPLGLRSSITLSKMLSLTFPIPYSTVHQRSQAYLVSEKLRGRRPISPMDLIAPRLPEAAVPPVPVLRWKCPLSAGFCFHPESSHFILSSYRTNENIHTNTPTHPTGMQTQSTYTHTPLTQNSAVAKRRAVRG